MDSLKLFWIPVKYTMFPIVGLLLFTATFLFEVWAQFYPGSAKNITGADYGENVKNLSGGISLHIHKP